MARTKPPLELAARALCELAGNPPGATTGGHPLWKSYLPEARAVLWAIREPGQEYVSKVAENAEDVIAWGDYREFWQAMIDTALKEV